MSRRKEPGHEQSVVVTWRVVPWEELPPAQRCAWDKMWGWLLSPPTGTNGNAPEVAISGASTIRDAASEDPAADPAAP